MSTLLLSQRRKGFNLRQLPSGVLVFAHEVRGEQTVGGAADGARVGSWADIGPASDPLTSSGTNRPVFRAARRGGRPLLEFDVDNVEDRFLAGAVNRTLTHLLVVAKYRKPNTTRDASQAGPAAFDGYRGVAGLNGYDGLYPGGQASVILTGNNGLSTFFDAYSSTTWRADGVDGSPASMVVGYERTTHLWEISRSGTYSGYPLVVGRDRGFAGATTRWRGDVRAVVGLSSPSSPQLEAVRRYLAWYQQGSLVCFTGDSLTAGYGVSTYGSHAALLDDAYEGTVDVPNIAIPGQGLAISTYGATPNLLASDPAKLSALTAGRGAAARVLVVWVGTNDLALGRSAAQVTADLWTYCDAARVAGWKVIVCTLIDRTDQGGAQATFNANRATVNGNIGSQWSSHADYLVDFAANANLGPNGSANNTTYFNADKVHLSALSYASVLLPLVQTAVETFLPA